jgi:hypothetical protein
MKKRLLMIGLLASSLTMMAQDIFNFGFETPSSGLTVGKLDMVNFLAGDTHDSINSTAHTGTYALMLQNANTLAGSNYQRALKFRNLPIEPNTSYRLTFWVKGNNTYTLAGGTTSSASNIRARMEVGKENADVAFVGTGNKNFDYTFTGFDPANWVKKSAVFYYTSDEVQKAYYKSLNPDSAALETKYFMNLNVYNPGTYYMDDISIKKSTIKGISYNGDVIKVDFGYAINGDALRTGKDYNIASLPIGCVNVTLDGVQQDVEAVEVQASGFLIFLATAYLDDTAEGKLKVSFTNPVATPNALKYTDALRPNSWDTNSNMMVQNFTNEESNYDMNLSGLSSSLYYAPFLKSASPENEAFDMPLTARTFKLVYSKKIDCSAVKANLSGTGGSFKLNLTETGFSDTLTFKVPDANSLADGNVVITISNIISEQGTPAEANTLLSYSYGASAGGATDTVYADKWSVHRTTQMIPTGWYFKSKEFPAGRASGTTQGSGPRLFYFTTTSNFGEGFYMRTSANPDTAHMTYGTYADKRLHVKAGKHKLSLYAIGWKVANQPLNVVLKDTLGNVVYRHAVANTDQQGGAQGATTVCSKATLNEFTFIVPAESDYLLDFELISAGYPEVLFGKILMISVPSTAALYKNMLTSALTIAKANLLLADSSIYNGTDKNALQAAIQTYSVVSYTTPSEYTAATAVVNTAAANMTTYKAKVDAHFASIVTYNTNLATAKTTRDTYVGTKYEVLDCFPKLVKVVTFYDGKSLTNDDSLKVANDTLPFYTNLVKNTVGTAIPALTYRLKKATTLARALKVPVPEADLAAADAAFTDNDQIAHALLIKIKQYLGHNLALDSIKFGSSLVDPTATDSLEMTCFMKNPNFYTSKQAQGLDMATYPGWVVSTVAGGGINDLPTTVNPIRDTYATVFNTKVDSFFQVVTGLPNGVYNVNMHARTGAVGTTGVTQADIDKFLKFYVIHGTDTTNVGFMQAAFGLPTAYISVRNVTVTDGTLTLGVRTTASPFSGYTPSLFWGDPTLWMVGKAGTYTGVKELVATPTVKDVQYFTIQGFRMNAPGRGLNIVKTIYSNGTVKVEKVMIR